MEEALRHKVYIHQKRFGQFTRGKRRKQDDVLTSFAKENECNSIAEIRVFVHRGYPVKNVKAKRIKDGIEVSTGKSNFNVKVEETQSEITGPEIGTELEMRLINNDPCFWLIGKRKVEEKDENAPKKVKAKKNRKSENPKAEVAKTEEKGEEKKTSLQKANAKKKSKKCWAKQGNEKKQAKQENKKKQQLKQKQQRNKKKRKRKESQDGKAGKKRKLNNKAKKKEASRNLIAQLASTDEDSKRNSLKKSHERVEKFEEKLEKKQFLSKRQKMQVMKVKGAFNEKHTKRKTKKQKKGKAGGKKNAGKTVRFAA